MKRTSFPQSFNHASQRLKNICFARKKNQSVFSIGATQLTFYQGVSCIHSVIFCYPLRENPLCCFLFNDQSYCQTICFYQTATASVWNKTIFVHFLSLPPSFAQMLLSPPAAKWINFPAFPPFLFSPSIAPSTLLQILLHSESYMPR